MNSNEKQPKKKKLIKEIWKSKYLYLLVLPYMLWLIIWCYCPMYGITLAFKDYKGSLGILGSPWVGLKNIKRIFVTPMAYKAILNTIEISLSRLIFEFPVPIILAIMITEMRAGKIKKVCQTILTFPHFISWVVVSSVMFNFFSGNGAINTLLMDLGLERMNFLGSKSLIKPILYITSNWKGMGWGAIIYMAAIMGIDPSLYEAATIDGASRWQQIWHITLPGIKSTIIIMFILAIGGVMNAGFDQIYFLRNSITSKTINVLDTYIYDLSFGATPDYSFSTAVGLFKNVINFMFLTMANRVVGKISGQKLFH